MKPKLSKVRRGENLLILKAVSKAYQKTNTDATPWLLLGQLISVHERRLGALADELKSVVKERNIAQYMSLQSYNDPQLYGSCSEEYLAATTVLSFLKKYPFGKVAGLDPDGAAVASFYRAEKLCRIATKRLRFYLKHGFRLDRRRPGMFALLHRARMLVHSWLGEVDLNKVYLSTRHGPGASIGVNGTGTTAYFKYAAPSYTVTPRARPYACAAILADDAWRRYVVNPQCNIFADPLPAVSDSWEAVLNRLKVVNYNKVAFVPKTAKTSRSIAVEPEMNIYLQLGVGAVLRDILRNLGVNLNSQSRNQKLALAGSCWHGRQSACPVTLDMSMASDTVNTELVKFLLPEDWFNLLDDLRSHKGLLGTDEVHWAKFSSMGNGFTFELESLIFFALASAVKDEVGTTGDKIAVYGDDVIVPMNSALRLTEVLNFVGFVINTEKSCYHGPFRESCGADFIEGKDVRPFFLKREIKRPLDLFVCRNAFFIDERFDYQPFVDYIDGRLGNLICTNLRGPVSESLDGHLFSPWDVAQASRFVLWDKGYQKWSYVSIRETAREFPGQPNPLYLQLLEGSKNDNSDHDYFKVNDDGLSTPVVRVTRSQTYGLGLSAPFESFPVDVRDALRTFDRPEPLNRGKVTRRKSTRLSVVTSFCEGWRNFDSPGS